MFLYALKNKVLLADDAKVYIKNNLKLIPVLKYCEGYYPRIY